MNVKLITKAMHTLSLLSEDDVAMVMKLRGLSEDERQMLMLVLEPNAKSAKKPTKKPAGKGGGGKSARASGMAEQLNKQLGNRREPEIGGFADDADMVCAYQYSHDSAVNAGLRCGEGVINGVHDKSMGYAGYHEFVAPPAASTGKSDAQSAAGGS